MYKHLRVFSIIIISLILYVLYNEIITFFKHTTQKRVLSIKLSFYFLTINTSKT